MNGRAWCMRRASMLLLCSASELGCCTAANIGATRSLICGLKFAEKEKLTLTYDTWLVWEGLIKWFSNNLNWFKVCLFPAVKITCKFDFAISKNGRDFNVVLTWRCMGSKVCTLSWGQQLQHRRKQYARAYFPNLSMHLQMNTKLCKSMQQN